MTKTKNEIYRNKKKKKLHSKYLKIKIYLNLQLKRQQTKYHILKNS
jgi:hypothetical protein